MAKDNKSVVIEIVSDARKFIDGFEEAINIIEKAAKKADIIGSIQTEIETVKSECSELGNIIKNIKPESNNTEFKNLEKKLDSLDNKIKYLKNNFSNIGAKIDLSAIEKAKEDLNGLLKQIKTVSKNTNIQLSTTNQSKETTNLENLRDSYYAALDAFEDFEESKKKNGNKYSDEYKKTAEELYKIASIIGEVDLLIEKRPDLQESFLSPDELDQVWDTMNKIEQIIKGSINNINQEVKKINIASIISGEIENGNSAEVKNYSVKNGKITVPLEVSTTESQLAKQTNKIIENAQKKVKPIAVSIKVASSTTESGLKKELKETTGDLTTKNLLKDYTTTVKKDLTAVLSEMELKVKESIKEIRRIIKEEKFVISPTVELKETDREKLKSELEKLSSFLQITQSTDKLQKSLKELTDAGLVEKWGRAFNKIIDNICKRIETSFEKIKIESKDLYKTSGAIQIDKEPTYEMVSVLNEMVSTMKTINSNKINVNFDGFNEILQHINSLGGAISDLNELLDTKNISDLANIEKSLQAIVESINYIVLAFQTLSSIFKENVLSKEFTKISKSITSIPEILNEILKKTNEFRSQIEQVEPSLNDIFNSVKQKFINLSFDDQQIDARTKEFKELIKLYNEYLQLGGKEPVSSITDNIQSQDKIIKALEKINEEKKELSIQSNINLIDKKQIEQIQQLEDVLDRISLAINNKNKLFEREKNIVNESVQQEREDLQRLITKINSVSSALKEIIREPIKLNVSIDGLNKISNLFTKKNLNDNIQTMINSLSDFASEINKLEINSTFINSINSILEKGNELENLASIIKSNSSFKTKSEKQNNKSINLSPYNNYLIKYQKTFSDISLKNISKNGYTESFILSIEQAKKSLEEYEKILLKIQNDSSLVKQTDLDKLANLQKYITDISEGLRNQEHQLADTGSIEKLSSKISKVLNENSNMSSELKNNFVDLQERLESFGGVIDKISFKKLGDEFYTLNAELQKSGKLGRNFLDLISNRIKGMNASFISMYFSLYDVIRYLKEATNIVKELDSALTELRKVSNATETELNQALKEATRTAKELGSSIIDVVNIQADWARLGYSVQEAEQLAKITTLFKTIGDNMDATSASEYLVSTLQGFQMSADQAIEIVDKYNEVANNFAIDTAGIGEALQRSAASFNAANTSLSKSIALVTATNEVVQNPEVVGTLWKTLSARIRGATTELKELGEETDQYTETTSKLRELIKSLTGFDIMLNENTYKDVYEIVMGIGKEWNNLTDIEQASLGEALAGKRSANALYAVLGNLDTLEEAYQSAENAAGSAIKEQENYAKSIQYSLDVFKATVEETVNNLINSDLVKQIVDFGTKFIGMLNDIGNTVGKISTPIISFFIDLLNIITDILDVLPGFVTLFGAIGGITIAKNFDNITNFIKTLNQKAIEFDKSNKKIIDALKTIDELSINYPISQNDIDFGSEAYNVYLYKDALKSLTEEEAKEVLMRKSISEENADNILSLLGLKQATDSLALSQVKEKISLLPLEEAKKKEILINMENASINGILTKEKLEEIITNSTLSESEKELVQAKLLTIIANNGEVASIKMLLVYTKKQIAANAKYVASLAAAHPMLTAFIAILGGLIAAYKAEQKYEEKQTKLLEDITEKTNQAHDSLKQYKEEITEGNNELEKINDELESVKSHIKNISSLGQLSIASQNELSTLRNQNNELLTQKSLLEKNIKLKQTSAALDAKSLLNSEVTGQYSSFNSATGEITNKEEVYTYSQHIQYQINALENAYSLYNRAISTGTKTEQEEAKKYLDVVGQNANSIALDILNIIESFKDENGNILTGYEDIYNEYLGYIYNLNSYLDQNYFYDIAKTIADNNNLDYEKIVNEILQSIYDGNTFNIENIDQAFLEALNNAGISKETIEYIFQQRQAEYNNIIEQINQKYPISDPNQKYKQQYLDVNENGETIIWSEYIDLPEQEKRIIEQRNVINKALKEYAENHPIDFNIITSYDADFSELDKIIQDEIAKLEDNYTDLDLFPVINDLITNFVNNIKQNSTQIKTDIISVKDVLLNEDSQKKINELKSSLESMYSAYQDLATDSIKPKELLDAIQQITENANILGKDINWEILNTMEPADQLAYLNTMLHSTAQIAKETFVEQFPQDRPEIQALASDLYDAMIQVDETRAKISALNQNIDDLQASYEATTTTIEAYNEQGFLTLDNLQTLLTADENYIQMLEIENGKLVINEEAYKNLALAKLEEIKANLKDAATQEMEALAAQKASGAILAEKEVMAGTISTVDEFTDHLLQNAAAQELTNNEINNIAEKYAQIYDSLKIGLEKSFGSFMGGSNKSAKKATDDAKNYIDAMMDYYEKALDAGQITFKEYTEAVKKMLDDAYNSGKISAEEYFSYIEQYTAKQVEIYEKVIDAVLRRYDKEIEAIQKNIDEIEKQNDKLNEQKDNYDKILDAIQKVYDDEIKRLQEQQDAIDDQIDKIDDEADAYDLLYRKEQALYELERAQNQRTKKVLTEDGYVYKTDTKSITDAKKNLNDISTEEIKKQLEDEKQALQDTIDLLEKYKEAWAEVPNMYDDAVNAALAMELFGQGYKDMLLNNSISIEEFATNYMAIQQQLDDNQSMIDSYNEKIEYYEMLKEEWENLKTQYEEHVEEMYAAEMLGAEWEKEALKGRLDQLTDFTNRYIELQQAQADAAVKAAKAKADAEKGLLTDSVSVGGHHDNSDFGGNFDNSGDNTTIQYEYSYYAVNSKGQKTQKFSSYDDAYDEAYDRGTDWVVKTEKKIKKFGKGTTSAPSGIAEVAEAGKGEIIVDNDGNALYVPDKTLYDFEGGERVYSGNETEKIIKNAKEIKPLYSAFNLPENYQNFIKSMNPNTFMNTHQSGVNVGSIGTNIPNVTNQNVTIQIGDIVLQGVNNVDTLSNEIVKRLPNMLVQKLK